MLYDSIASWAIDGPGLPASVFPSQGQCQHSTGLIANNFSGEGSVRAVSKSTPREAGLVSAQQRVFHLIQ